MIDVASSCVQLQEARHEADYNSAARFTRREALDLAEPTDQVFRGWGRVGGSMQADTFLTGLLAMTQPLNSGRGDVESIVGRMGSMKRRLTEQQIISMIREQEAGLKPFGDRLGQRY